MTTTTFTIYIPSLHSKTSQKQVFWAFKERNLGYGKTITLIPRKNEEGKTWQAATVEIDLKMNFEAANISDSEIEDRKLTVALYERLENDPKGYLKMHYNPDRPEFYWVLKKWLPKPVVDNSSSDESCPEKHVPKPKLVFGDEEV